jgi:hypothetical protein
MTDLLNLLEQTEPDLEFYYDLDITKTVFSNFSFGSTTILTKNSTLFNSNPEISIGKVSITNTLYNITDTSQLSVNTASASAYHFLDGTIQYIAAQSMIKNSQGNYVWPPGVFILNIVSGSGKYLNAKGYILVKSEGLIRDISIYFTNKSEWDNVSNC